MPRWTQPTLASILIVLVSAISSAKSQLDWLTTHDEPLGEHNSANDCAVDAIGNVYAAGGAVDVATQQSDFELVKFSPSGAVLWSALADVHGGDDGAFDCQVSAAGDVYICGQSQIGSSGDTDAVLLKYSSAGALQWVRGLASPSGYNLANAIAFDSAGNVLVCGTASGATTGWDALVESYTPAGILNWSALVDGGASLGDQAASITSLDNGDIAIAGYSHHPTGAGDLAVWKLSAGGAVLWSAHLDGGANAFDLADVIVESDAGKLVAGGYRLVGNLADWMVVQLDGANGAVDWTAYHDGTAHSQDRVRSIAVDALGIVWVSGLAANVGTHFDFVTQRFDSAGTLLSSTTWNNGAGSVNDQPYKLLLGSAGQAWVTGFSGSPPSNVDAVIVQLDSSGAFNWSRIYTSTGSFGELVLDAALAPGNRLAMAGRTNTGPNGDNDVLALQVDLNDSPQAYCTAKTTSTGCVPAVTFSGMPSVSASNGFVVSATQLRNQKNGLLFYGTSGGLAVPFQGGRLCVAAPTARTSIQNSGGNAVPADDCSGSFALDMNAYATGALGGTPMPVLQVAGTAVHCQFWGRDPGFAAPQNTMLSNALRYVVLP